MVWKSTPDDTKTVIIKAIAKPPPPEKPPNWFTKMREWLQGVVGKQLPELPVEKL